MANSKFEALKRLLNQIDTPEKALALKGVDRAEYLNALDNVYGNQAQRAADMGFSPETWYHGTPNEFVGNAIDFKKSGNTSGINTANSFALTDNPNLASEYADFGIESGNNILPLRLNPENIELRDANGRMIKNSIRTAQVNDAISNNKSGLIYKNLLDDPNEFEQKIANIAFVKDPSKIRSVNAAFDPRFKDSPYIMSANQQELNLGQKNLFPNSMAVLGKKAISANEEFIPRSEQMGWFEKTLEHLDTPGRMTRAGIGALQGDGDVLDAIRGQVGVGGPEAPSGFDIASKFGDQYGIENPYALTAIATAADVLDPTMLIPGGQTTKIAPMAAKIAKKISKVAETAETLAKGMYKAGNITFPAKNEAEAIKIMNALKAKGDLTGFPVLVKGDEAAKQISGGVQFMDDAIRPATNMDTKKFDGIKQLLKAKSQLK